MRYELWSIRQGTLINQSCRQWWRRKRLWEAPYAHTKPSRFHFHCLRITKARTALCVALHNAFYYSFRIVTRHEDHNIFNANLPDEWNVGAKNWTMSLYGNSRRWGTHLYSAFSYPFSVHKVYNLFSAARKTWSSKPSQVHGSPVTSSYSSTSDITHPYIYGGVFETLPYPWFQA